jgi:hypothetical protein
MEKFEIPKKPMSKHTREGLRILARIIARDFMAKQALNGDGKNGDADSEHLRDK